MTKIKEINNITKEVTFKNLKLEKINIIDIKLKLLCEYTNSLRERFYNSGLDVDSLITHLDRQFIIMERKIKGGVD